jgi:dipeptidyl aminopeptidase/acylaminoacyl peptidase
MTTRRTPLTDDQIEALLLARSVDADRALVDRILAATGQLPQRRRGWLPLELDRRTLSLITAALLLAALAGAMALAGRYVLPDRDLDPPLPGPEGGWILYVDSTGDPYISDLGGDGPQQIEGTGGPVRCPTFSPDGRLLAFNEERRVGDTMMGEVVVAVVGGDGSLETRLRIPARYGCPRWSPDGRSLAFLDAYGGVSVDTLGAGCRDDKGCEVSSSVGLGATTAEVVAWSYDGSTLVVLSDGAVIAQGLDGGPPGTLYETARGEELQEQVHLMVTSPTGPYVALAGERDRTVSASSSMFESGIVRVIDMAGRTVFEESTDHALLGESVAWSPDGTRLAWADRSRIAIHSTDSGAETTFLELPPMTRPGWDGPVEDVEVGQIAWSPDGRRFLLNVSSDSVAHAHAIVSIAADGSGDVVLHSEWTAALEAWGGFDWQP